MMPVSIVYKSSGDPVDRDTNMDAGLGISQPGADRGNHRNNRDRNQSGNQTIADDGRTVTIADKTLAECVHFIRSHLNSSRDWNVPCGFFSTQE